eukprot:GEMP01008250.1.p1 GENE.GEMP01008250.1~~GEMP01008250.1.p1  ORF type:complete len:642 (+),score=163.91 GEMP01008250.1:427-2352(+)
MEPNIQTPTLPEIVITSSAVTDTSVLRQTKKTTVDATSSLSAPLACTNLMSTHDSGVLPSSSSRDSCVVRITPSAFSSADSVRRPTLLAAAAIRGDPPLDNADCASNGSSSSTSTKRGRMMEDMREFPSSRKNSDGNTIVHGHIARAKHFLCKALGFSRLAPCNEKNDIAREDDEGIAIDGQCVPRTGSTTSWHMDGMVDYLILQYLDARSLGTAESVCRHWRDVSDETRLWKTLVANKVRNVALWQQLSVRHGWASVVDDSWKELANGFYKSFYARVERDAVVPLSENWRKLDVQASHTITMHNDAFKGVYCFQQDTDTIMCGLRNNSIRIYKRDAAEHFPLLKCLHGHMGSVLSLSVNKQGGFFVSGSSDAAIRVWDMRNNYKCVAVLHSRDGNGHQDGVLHVAVNGMSFVSCSKDRTVKLWNISRDPNTAAISVALRSTLHGHRSAVNVVDFDERYIVSGGGDRVICVWDTKTLQIKHELQDHSRGVSCLHYQYPLMCSGSSDNTVGIWDVETGQCIRRLLGHEGLVRCVRFTDTYICTGAYDGTIKIWDLPRALSDAPVPNAAEGAEEEMNKYCLRTFRDVHSSRVFRVMMDEFSLISSSQDDTVVIMDFVDDVRWTQTNEAGAEQRQLALTRLAGA